MVDQREDAINVAALPDIPPPSLRTMAIEAESLGKQKKVGRFRHFEILCDEPPRLGGDDEYPQPLTYLVAGVAF
jgi:hypothetical protein